MLFLRLKSKTKQKGNLIVGLHIIALGNEDFWLTDHKKKNFDSRHPANIRYTRYKPLFHPVSTRVF